jgi:hypothetical protein
LVAVVVRFNATGVKTLVIFSLMQVVVLLSYWLGYMMLAWAIEHTVYQQETKEMEETP